MLPRQAACACAFSSHARTPPAARAHGPAGRAADLPSPKGHAPAAKAIREDPNT
jgi:hypothetical protein